VPIARLVYIWLPLECWALLQVAEGGRPVYLGAGLVAASNTDRQVKDILANLVDGLAIVYYRAGIRVHIAAHAVVRWRIARYLN